MLGRSLAILQQFRKNRTTSGDLINALSIVDGFHPSEKYNNDQIGSLVGGEQIEKSLETTT